MDSSVDSSLATEGFPEDVCQSNLSPDMSELLTFNDITLCVRCQRSLGVKQKKDPEREGGAVHVFNERIQSSTTFIQVSMVTERTQKQSPSFPPPSHRVETAVALQVRRTPAAAFYQSQRRRLPGAQRHGGLQFSNLMVQNNLKVFPQIGSHLQCELHWREQATQTGFMNSFKSPCLCIIVCFTEERSHGCPAHVTFLLLYVQLKVWGGAK